MRVKLDAKQGLIPFTIALTMVIIYGRSLLKMILNEGTLQQCFIPVYQVGCLHLAPSLHIPTQ